MFKSSSFTRRHALILGGSGLIASSVAPGLAWAKSGEDPAAIITAIADDAFDLFGANNGTSNSWSSRRAWAEKVTKSRFATDLMGEKAGGVFLKDFSTSKLRTYNILIENVVSEFLLDIFAVYEPNTVFTVDRVRLNRSKTATIMDSTVVAHGENYKVKWTVVDDGGKCKVSDVSIFGLNLVSDFRSSFEKAFRDKEAGGVIAMLQQRIRRGERKYPN